MILNGLEINGFNQEDVNALYPNALMIETMKTWTLPKNKKHMKSEVCSNGEYFGQIKKDGYWYEWEITADDSYLFSRNASRTTGLLTEKSANVPHIDNWLSNKLPAGTIVVGEIYIPGKTSKDVTKIMGCLPKKAIERQKKDGYVKFYIHDILYFAGKPLLQKGALDRYSFLEKVVKTLNLDEPEFIELAETYYENIEDVLADAFARGEEGMVLKKKDVKYFPTKRPAWSSIKFKKETPDLDVVCLGFEPPTKEYEGKEPETWKFWEKDGKLCEGTFFGHEGYVAVSKPYFRGWIGSIKIGAYDGDKVIQLGTVSSGITEALLEDIRLTKGLWYDKPLVVGGMEVDCEEKTIRHPFVNSQKGRYGFRDDIDSKDCTMEKIFG